MQSSYLLPEKCKREIWEKIIALQTNLMYASGVEVYALQTALEELQWVLK